MNLASELFWEDEKQPVVPQPARPHDRQQNKQPDDPAPAAQADDLNRRLQQVAGNAALAREAEEAKAAQKKVADAARQPSRKPEASAPAREREAEARAKPSRKAQSSDSKAGAEKRAAERAAAAEAQRLSEETKAAARRSAALAQVLASFEKNAGKAELLVLAQLAETAPPDIAEETARALALAVMRADPEQRAAIAARIKTEIGARHDLALAHLLADRLAWLVIAPPPPPPPDP